MLGQALLLEAAELAARGWTQRAEAIDAAGNPVDPWDEAAVAWSLLGALVAAMERRTPPGGALVVAELAAACVALLPYVDDDDLKTWNDVPQRTQADIVSGLRAAADDAGDPGVSMN